MARGRRTPQLFGSARAIGPGHATVVTIGVNIVALRVR
jgi:hypothetical protein